MVRAGETFPNPEQGLTLDNENRAMMYNRSRTPSPVRIPVREGVEHWFTGADVERSARVLL